jgi:hypothetical protein
MANKFVIIPKELYAGLLASRTSSSNKHPKTDLREMGPLERAQKELIQVQKSKRKTGAKNILYQQLLRRYLRLRKQAKGRPIRVAMENGAKVQLKPVGNAEVQIRPPRLSEPGEQMQAAVLDEDADIWQEAMMEPEQSSAVKTRTARIITPASRIRLPEDAGPSINGGASWPTGRKAKQEQREQRLTEAIDEIYDLVRQEPQRFGVTDDGKQILSRHYKLPVEKSNTKRSIEYIVRGLPGSPVGTSTLRNKLDADPYIKELLRPLQFGRGTKRDKKKSAAHKPTKFRPEKWQN